MERQFYQISDPTQDGPEESVQWVEQLVREVTICADCGGIITPKVIDVHIGEKNKEKFFPCCECSRDKFSDNKKGFTPSTWMAQYRDFLLHWRSI